MTTLSLKPSIYQLQTSRRSSMNHEFISGVFSSCVLQMISKLRKNFEFTMESIEEVEKCYFKNNGQNFINVAPEYEYIVNAFCRNYLELQKELNNKVLNTYLIRPLSELTKNTEAFKQCMEVSMEALRQRYNTIGDIDDEKLLKTEDYAMNENSLKIPSRSHGGISGRKKDQNGKIIGFDSSLLHKPGKPQWNILGTQKSTELAQQGQEFMLEDVQSRDLTEQIKLEQEELKMMEMKRKKLDLRLQEEIDKQRRLNDDIDKLKMNKKKSNITILECSTDELRSFKLDISSCGGHRVVEERRNERKVTIRDDFSSERLSASIKKRQRYSYMKEKQEKERKRSQVILEEEERQSSIHIDNEDFEKMPIEPECSSPGKRRVLRSITCLESSNLLNSAKKRKFPRNHISSLKQKPKTVNTPQKDARRNKENSLKQSSLIKKQKRSKLKIRRVIKSKDKKKRNKAEIHNLHNHKGNNSISNSPRKKNERKKSKRYINAGNHLQISSIGLRGNYSDQTSISRLSDLENRPYSKELSEQERENFKNWANKQTMSSVCQTSSMRYSADFKMNLSQRKAVEEIQLIGTDYNHSSLLGEDDSDLIERGPKSKRKRILMSKSSKKEKKLKNKLKNKPILELSPNKKIIRRRLDLDYSNTSDPDHYSQRYLRDNENINKLNLKIEHQKKHDNPIMPIPRSPREGRDILDMDQSTSSKIGLVSSTMTTKIPKLQNLPNLLKAPVPGGLSSFCDDSPYKENKVSHNEYVTFHEKNNQMNNPKIVPISTTDRKERKERIEHSTNDISDCKDFVYCNNNDTLFQELSRNSRDVRTLDTLNNLIDRGDRPERAERGERGDNMRIVQYSDKPLLKMEASETRPTISTWEASTPRSKVLKPLTLKLYHGHRRRDGKSRTSPQPFNLLETFSDPGDDSTYRERLADNPELMSPSYQHNMIFGRSERKDRSISPQSTTSYGKKVVIKGESNRKAKGKSKSTYLQNNNKNQNKRVSTSKREAKTTWRRLDGRGGMYQRKSPMRVITGDVQVKEAVEIFRKIEDRRSSNYVTELGELNESSLLIGQSGYKKKMMYSISKERSMID